MPGEYLNASYNKECSKWWDTSWTGRLSICHMANAETQTSTLAFTTTAKVKSPVNLVCFLNMREETRVPTQHKSTRKVD